MSDKGKAPASSGASPSAPAEPDTYVALCRIACAGKDGRRLDLEAGDVVDACDEDMLALLESGGIAKRK